MDFFDKVIYWHSWRNGLQYGLTGSYNTYFCHYKLICISTKLANCLWEIRASNYNCNNRLHSVSCENFETVFKILVVGVRRLPRSLKSGSELANVTLKLIERGYDSTSYTFQANLLSLELGSLMISQKTISIPFLHCLETSILLISTRLTQFNDNDRVQNSHSMSYFLCCHCFLMKMKIILTQ